MKRVTAISICLILLFSSTSVYLGADGSSEKSAPGASPLSPGPGPTPRSVLLSENFSAPWVPCGSGYDAPPGWAVDGISVGNNGPYLTHYWSQFDDAVMIPLFGESTSNSTPYAAGLWWSNGAGETNGTQQDEWLMTPPLDFTNYIDCRLNFNAIYVLPMANPGVNEHNYIKASTDGGQSWDILGDLNHDPIFDLPICAGWPVPNWCWYEMHVPGAGCMPIDISVYDGEPSVIIAWHVDNAGIGPRGIHCVDDVHVDGTYDPPPPVDHIVVTPDPAFVTVGETQQFTATAYDVFNVTIPGVIFFWSTDVGVVNSTGFFTAQTTLGTGYVNATYGTVTGSAYVSVVVDTPDHIIVTPSHVTLPVGGTQQFLAAMYDMYDNIIPGVEFNWATDVGSVDATGFFIAQTTPGAGMVTATNGTITGAADVLVENGPIDHIIVSPDPITIMAGEPMPLFTVTAYDVYDNVIPGVTCNWTSNVWNETGHYILPPGEAGWINFTCGNCSYNVTVNVIFGPIDHIIVTPDPAFVIVGMTQQFTATAYDVYNNVIPGIGLTWSSNVGIINSTGFFTAFTIPKTGTVTATNGTVSGSANVIIVEAIFDIDLNIGWNLISLPLKQYNESIDQVLISIDGKWDCIRAYDAMNDTWLSNCTFIPDPLNTLKTLNHKIGFWINITEANVTLTVGGSIPVSTSINMYAGWNLVGYPTLNNSTTVADALWGTGADRVMAFNASAPYQISEIGPTYVMKPGEGYWVHVPADTTWVIDW